MTTPNTFMATPTTRPPSPLHFEHQAEVTNNSHFINASRTLIDMPRETAKDWFILGATLEPYETVKLTTTATDGSGKQWTSFLNNVECFRRSVMMDYSQHVTWAALADALEDDETLFIIHATTLTKLDCYIQALILNDKKAGLWYRFGNFLGRSKRSAIQVGEDKVNRQQCYLRAIHIDSKYSEAWHQLGLTLSANAEDVVEFKGKEFDAAMCFIMAIITATSLSSSSTARAHNPLHVADAPSPDSSTCPSPMHHPRTPDCSSTPGSVASSNITAGWLSSSSAGPGTSGCFDHRFAGGDLAACLADCWYRLGLIDPKGKKFLARRWTALECFGEAIHQNAFHVDAWHALKCSMGESDTVPIGDEVLSFTDVCNRVRNLDSLEGDDC